MSVIPIQGLSNWCKQPRSAHHKPHANCTGKRGFGNVQPCLCPCHGDLHWSEYERLSNHRPVTWRCHH